MHVIDKRAQSAEAEITKQGVYRNNQHFMLEFTEV